MPKYEKVRGEVVPSYIRGYTFRCSECRKTVETFTPEDWAYKMQHNGYIKRFCSWKCLQAFRARIGPPPKPKYRNDERNEKIRALFFSGKSIREVADELHVTVGVVQGVIKRTMEAKK